MIVAIIQARMGSKRCEGKVMKSVLDKPLIGHLFERLTFSSKIDKIVLATSIDKQNDVMCEYVESLGFSVFRGDEDDVLDRYYKAALLYKADNIVRITGDCPLIDVGICDKLFEMYLNKKAEYAHLSSRFAEGLDCEIFSFGYLSTAWKEAKKKSEREHVTLYINNNLDRFKKEIMDNCVDDSSYRITVDEPEDLDVVKNIIENLYKEGIEPFDFKEVKKFLDGNPETYNKNAHIVRNEGLILSLKNDKCEEK
ncbi:MAG: glycosyltransferase family protein [Candidatus Zapsychrus exili]|nr:glycosyltransferase family protein [Candidatus Zapsychrus exili]